MRAIIQYIRTYFSAIDKFMLIAVSLFTAVLIFINYNFGLDHYISRQPSFSYRLLARFILFAIAFLVPFFFCYIFNKVNYFKEPRYLLLLFIAPLLFSLKVALSLPFRYSEDPDWNAYWQHIAYWPILAIIVGSILFIIWKFNDRDQPFYGITTKNLDWRPYLLMLMIMVPLIAAASTQPDFLAVYPKLKLISQVYVDPGLSWLHKLLFELSYGSDFITIELFFRGFLVLAFIKLAGKDVILPMACFYCTIHFGKPLGECISSFAGGILLGIIVYNTRSILGGLMVHLGIAWLMELGGHVGNSIFN